MEYEEMPELIDTRELPAVFIIDRETEYPTKSKDELAIAYMSEMSAQHFSNRWSDSAAVYIVHNLTKVNKNLSANITPAVIYYTVAFYRVQSGENIIAACDCKARVVCKHIARSWAKHIEAEKMGFIKTI